MCGHREYNRDAHVRCVHVVAHGRASARGTSPSSLHPRLLPLQFDLTRCAATREKVNYAVNEKYQDVCISTCMYIGICMYIYGRGVLPKRETCLDRYVDERIRMKLGFTTGERRGRVEGERKGWRESVHGGKYLFAAAIPQDQSLRRWCRSVSWTILHSGTGIMRGLIGRSSTSNRSTRDGCNLQGK